MKFNKDNFQVTILDNFIIICNHYIMTNLMYSETQCTSCLPWTNKKKERKKIYW